MKGLRILLVVAAASVFLGSGAYLLLDHLTSEKDQRDLEKLVQIVEHNTDSSQVAVPESRVSSIRVRPAVQQRANEDERSQEPIRIETDLGQGAEPLDFSEPSGVTEPSGVIGSSGVTEPSGVAKPQASNDLAGLAVDMQDYLQRTITGASQSVELIRLEITPVAADGAAEDTDDDGPADEPAAAVISGQEHTPTNESAADDTSGQEHPPAVQVRARVYGRVGSDASRQAMADEIERIAERFIAGDEGWTVRSEIIDLDVSVEPAPILPQYQDLHEQNSDMIGWIRIEGTPVNYPVMQTPDDPEFYLRRNFEKQYAYSGLPFLDARCDVSEPALNLLIYGHNMKDGKMFGQLPNYESKSFWKQHQTIQFDLCNETRTYEVIGAFRSRQYKEGEAGFRYYDYIDLSAMNRFTEFIEQVKSASFIDTGVSAGWGDQLLTLSTCSYHANSGTFVVVAKRQT